MTVDPTTQGPAEMPTTDTTKRAAGFVATAMAKTPLGERAELLAEMMRQCAQGLCHINGREQGSEAVYMLADHVATEAA